MTAAKEARLRRLEERAQVGDNAPPLVTQVIITDPERKDVRVLWEHPDHKPDDGFVIDNVIVDPPARDLN